MSSVLLSRVWTGFLNPHRASTSCSSIERIRSPPTLATEDNSCQESAAVGCVALSRKKRSDSPGKTWMLPLFQDGDKVSRLLPWLLVSLPSENNLLSIFHACEEGQRLCDPGKAPLVSVQSPSSLCSHRTFVDVDLLDLLLPHDLSAGAGFAAVLQADLLTLPLTILAPGGHLLHYSWNDLLHENLHAAAVTRRARLLCSRTTAVACRDTRNQWGAARRCDSCVKLYEPRLDYVMAATMPSRSFVWNAGKPPGLVQSHLPLHRSQIAFFSTESFPLVPL